MQESVPNNDNKSPPGGPPLANIKQHNGLAAKPISVQRGSMHSILPMLFFGNVDAAIDKECGGFLKAAPPSYVWQRLFQTAFLHSRDVLAHLSCFLFVRLFVLIVSG